jgi:hypothetical protein
MQGPAVVPARARPEDRASIEGRRVPVEHQGDIGSNMLESLTQQPIEYSSLIDSFAAHVSDVLGLGNIKTRIAHLRCT